MKKWKMMVLTVMLMSLLLGICSVAAESDFVVEDGVLTEYKGNGGDIRIPDGVTSFRRIYFPAFEKGVFTNNTSLTSIVIPEGVVSLGSYAFYGCTNLKSVTIPDSLTGFDGHAFSNCSSLKSIKIPKSATTILNWTFEGCSNLTDVVIPDGVTCLDFGAFKDCTSLTQINIPVATTRIGRDAFKGCSSLKDIYYVGSKQQWAEVYIGEDAIPGGVTIHYNDGSSSVVEGTQDSTNNNDGNDSSIKKGDEYTYKNVLYKVLTLTGTEGTIEAVSAGNKSITSVNIPDTVKINGYSLKVVSVKSSAFAGCTKLKTVKLGKNIAVIGKKAFSGCTSLISINIPVSVTKLEDSTFSGCKKLKTVSGCNGVITVGNKVFYKCEKLMTVGSKSNTVTLNNVKTIGSNGFYGCKTVKKVNLTSTVLTKIGDSAFQGCTSMTSFASKSKKLTTIGKKAFFGDKKLATISLKTEKLKKTKVGSNAFKGIKASCLFKVPKKQISVYKVIFKTKGAGSKLKVGKL